MYSIDNARLRLDEDGILHQWFEPVGGTFHPDTMIRCNAVIEDLCGRGGRALICRIQGTRPTLAARRDVSDEPPLEACALVVNTKVSAMIGNMLCRLLGMGFPMRVFWSEAEARAWIDQVLEDVPAAPV